MVPVEPPRTLLRRARADGWLLRAGLFAPWIWYASMYVVWLGARVTLGRWPRPLLDDPKHLGGFIDVAQTLSVWLFLLGLASLAACLLVTLVRGLLGTTTGPGAFGRLGALAVSWIFALVYARLDPGHVIAWYLD